ncbi:hypothetical protein IFM89_028218 [Coptis chinensis]|uniref:Fold protein n=1 Tax=Coptis chinensis TaxID=261450 RepID=A0A835IPY7_9MAGN|nr:hypothetical protein IFM89_028218 [Coptis chinensis]
MASDDSMTINSSMHEDDYEEEDDHDHDQHHPHNLSRLSICSSKQSIFDFDDTCAGGGSGGDMMMMFMSGLSIESSYGEGEADEEFSDDHSKGENVSGASSDSDKDIGSSLSLPGTPRTLQKHGDAHKEYYCSETEAGGKGFIKNKAKRNSRTRVAREKWLESEWEKKQHKAKSMDGESEGLVLTKPNGGRKSMCMDLGEVKACRDLGFELEHPRMLEIPTQHSFSTMDTASSGGNSPISNWRISSPGDDPKDVKARLKVWAQVVAASASRLVA